MDQKAGQQENAFKDGDQISFGKPKNTELLLSFLPRKTLLRNFYLQIYTQVHTSHTDARNNKYRQLEKRSIRKKRYRMLMYLLIITFYISTQIAPPATNRIPLSVT